MYALKLNEMKTVIKLPAQEGKSGAVNKTAVESLVQTGDFQERKR
jgi:hypothetical protein